MNDPLHKMLFWIGFWVCSSFVIYVYISEPVPVAPTKPVILIKPVGP